MKNFCMVIIQVYVLLFKGILSQEKFLYISFITLSQRQKIKTYWYRSSQFTKHGANLKDLQCMNKIFSCIITQISCHGKRRCCLFLVLGLGSRNLCFQPKNVKVVPNLQVHQRPLKYENISFENYVIAELRKIQHTWVHSCPYHANWATRNYNNLEEICTSFFYYLNVKKS